MIFRSRLAILAGTVASLLLPSAGVATARAEPPPPVPAMNAYQPAPPIPPMNTIQRNGAIARRSSAPTPPPATDADWAGYAVTAASLNSITEVEDTQTVPAVDCAKTIIGSSGYAIVDDWVGIDGYGNSEVEQTGLETYCTGTSGHDATGGPYYGAWYYSCCSGTFTFYPGQPKLSAGDTIEFHVADTTSVGRGETYTYTFIDASDNDDTFTGTQACGAGSGADCADATGEVITEAPGGGPPDGWPLVSWSETYGNYTRIEVDGEYTTVQGEVETVDGNLDTEPGHWTASGPIDQNFTGLAYPYNIVGPPYGDPQSLSSGSAFDAYCTNYTSATSYTVCPG